MLNLTMKLNQLPKIGRGEGGERRTFCRICQGAGKPPSMFTSHCIAQCGSLSVWDREELRTSLKPFGGGDQRGEGICRVCQGARMSPLVFTSHSTAQCGSLSAWDREELYTALQGEEGQVEENDDEGQELQPNSA